MRAGKVTQTVPKIEMNRSCPKTWEVQIFLSAFYLFKEKSRDEIPVGCCGFCQQRHGESRIEMLVIAICCCAQEWLCACLWLKSPTTQCSSVINSRVFQAGQYGFKSQLCWLDAACHWSPLGTRWYILRGNLTGLGTMIVFRGVWEVMEPSEDGKAHRDGRHEKLGTLFLVLWLQERGKWWGLAKSCSKLKEMMGLK